METARFTSALERDLAAVAAVGDEATASAAERLIQALRGSAGMRLAETLGEAALEISAQLRQPADRLRPQLGGESHDVLPASVRACRGEDRPAPAAAPRKEAAVRSETFSTPGPVALRIRIPNGHVEIETGDTAETAVELEVHGRDGDE